MLRYTYIAYILVFSTIYHFSLHLLLGRPSVFALLGFQSIIYLNNSSIFISATFLPFSNLLSYQHLVYLSANYFRISNLFSYQHLFCLSAIYFHISTLFAYQQPTFISAPCFPISNLFSYQHLVCPAPPSLYISTLIHNQHPILSPGMYFHISTLCVKFKASHLNLRLFLSWFQFRYFRWTQCRVKTIISNSGGPCFELRLQRLAIPHDLTVVSADLTVKYCLVKFIRPHFHPFTCSSNHLLHIRLYMTSC